MSNRQGELARRLADKFHLSVPERAELDGGKVCWSEFVKAIGEILAEGGWYPSAWRPQAPYDGVIIEAAGRKLVLHERHEVGVQRFSEVRSAPADSLDHAARRFVAVTFGGSIDGVPFDWHR